MKKVRFRRILLYLSFTQDLLLGRFCVSSRKTAFTKKRCIRIVQVKFVLDVLLVTMPLIYTRLFRRWHSRFFPLSFEYDYNFELSNNSVFINPLLACENIRFSSLFDAGDVSRGGTSATQRQKFHTDDVKSVQNPVRSADWSTE